jgi:cobalt/nickel transport system permease protein
MTLSFDSLPNFDSPWNRIDPRWKLAGVILAVAAIIFLRTLPAAGLALAGALLLATAGQLPFAWFMKRIGALALFLLLFTVWLPFMSPDNGPSWEWGWLHFSFHGLELAAVFLCKGVAVVSLVLLALATTPFHTLFQAARALGIPEILVQVALLTHRYVFYLMHEFSRLRTALRVRGFRNHATLHSYRTIGHVAGTLLVRSSEQAVRVGQAMRCRGFDGRLRSLVEFRSRASDVGTFMLMVGFATGVLVWDMARR